MLGVDDPDERDVVDLVGHDIAFIGIDHPEYGPGFDVWVGGGLSTNPHLAQRLGAWVPLDEVPDVWVGVVSSSATTATAGCAPARD